MKLTLQLQLFPEPDHAARLKATIERFNVAANWLAREAFAIRSANKIELQKLHYQTLRERFGLSAQMTVRCIAQVCEAYKRDKSIHPEFRKHAAMPFDQRMMSFKGIDRVSLLTLEGRVRVAFVMGKYQTERFTAAKGQADLVLRHDGKWFLLVTVDVPNTATTPVTDFIGIDLGVNNIATDSDGGKLSGEKVEAARLKYGKRRKALQQAATEKRRSGKRPRSIRRKLAKDKARESRYRKDVNHCASKAYVESAKRTGRGIALEDLKGIRERVTASGGDARNRLHGWSFFQFRQFVEYKAQVAGVPVVSVDPSFTSQTCPECGYCDRRNRKTQATFRCIHCDHHDDADRNGARNIRARGVVMASQGDLPAWILRSMPMARPECRNANGSRKGNRSSVQAQGTFAFQNKPPPLGVGFMTFPGFWRLTTRDRRPCWQRGPYRIRWDVAQAAWDLWDGTSRRHHRVGSLGAAQALAEELQAAAAAATPVRVVVVTSCTGRKRTAAAAAEDLYLGEQHRRLMRGVHAARAAGDQVEVIVISAKYGPVAGDQVLEPYDETLTDLPEETRRLRCADFARRLQAQFPLAGRPDVALVLLGHRYDLGPLELADHMVYLKAAAPPQAFWRDTILPAGVAEARRFRVGLVGLKGEIAARLLERRIHRAPAALRRLAQAWNRDDCPLLAGGRSQ